MVYEGALRAAVPDASRRAQLRREAVRLPPWRRSLYLDASAFLKLVGEEAESRAAWSLIAGARLTSSELVAIEVSRGCQRMTAANRLADPFASLVLAEILLEDFTLHPITRAILRLAGRLFEPRLGSLDAIHVVTALEHRPFDAFVTYDERQATAARKVGLPTVSPGA